MKVKETVTYLLFKFLYANMPSSAERTLQCTLKREEKSAAREGSCEGIDEVCRDKEGKAFVVKRA